MNLVPFQKQLEFQNELKLVVYPKFLLFKIPNDSKKDTLSIRKRLLHSAIASITSHNKILLQKSLNTNRKNYLH